MKILKYKRIGIDRYKVEFDTTELILYEDVILKHSLITKKDINIKELESIIEDNKYYEMYNLALKYLGIKMRSEKELEDYLKNKDYSDNIAAIIERLKKEGYINEKKYIEAFINDSINLKNIGPYKIKEALIKNGFDEYIIDEYINNIDQSKWIEKINKYIKKYILKNKKYSVSILKQKILNDLYLKGYDKEMTYSLLENIKMDDSDSLNIEYNKALKKYSIKYKDIELKNKIISYLINKGFDYSRILEKISE